jgi:hypothetical protein
MKLLVMIASDETIATIINEDMVATIISDVTSFDNHRG